MPTIRLTLLAAAATFAVSFVGCNGETEPNVPVDAPEGVSPALQPVVSFLQKQMTSCGIPGAAIAVVQNGVIVDQAGLGSRDDDGTPVDPSTLFLTAALTKVVDGTMALRLGEQGKLDVTLPVTHYVPLKLASGFDPSQITVADLLADTSGLPDLDDSSLNCPVGPGQLGVWFGANDTEPLWTPPGSVWNYSQRGYAAAGWVIETASGQPVETAAAELVFGPGGMTTATYDSSVVTASGDYALGHEGSGGRLTTILPGVSDCEPTRAADGVYASVLDYAHFAQTLLAGGGSMLAPASVAALLAGQVQDGINPDERYGYGLYDTPVDGHAVLHVQGDMHGYDASLVLVPDEHLAVVVFFNGDPQTSGCTTDDAAAYAAEAYSGLQAPAPYTGTLDATGTPFAGTYLDPYELGTVSVAMQGGTLTATTSEYGAVPLTPLSATAFHGQFGSHGETVVFAPDPSGPAAWFVTRLGVGQRQ